MKTLSLYFFGSLLVLFTATCNNMGSEPTDTSNTTTVNQTDQMEVTGTIQQQGITSYQYGTHTISNDETFYALKSEKVDLDDYIDEEVTIVAEKIEGYPLSGGPDYLLVLEIKGN